MSEPKGRQRSRPAPKKAPEPKGETLLPSEVKAQRELAEAAGYVSSYPDEGQALVATIEDRCDSCQWTLFVSLINEVFCVNPKCTERNVRLVSVEEAS